MPLRGYGVIADWDENSSLAVYSKICVTSSTVYLVGLSKSLASYTLHVTSLSTQHGELVNSGDYPSSITLGLAQVLILNNVKAPGTVPQ